MLHGRGDPGRKEEILRTATELFAEHGFSDAITQALADRLQLGKGTIYRHFPSKRELFLAAADRVMRKMQEQILASIAGIEDGLEQVARGIKAFLSFFADHPEYVELLIQERAQFKDRKRPTYFEHREVNVAAVAEALRPADRRGPGPRHPGRADHRRRRQPDLRHHVHELLRGPGKPVEQQARDILDIVFHGILTEPGARSGSRPASRITVASLHAASRHRGFSCAPDIPGGSDTHGSSLVRLPS